MELVRQLKNIKVVFVLPDVLGFSGDVINERQLIKMTFKRTKVATYALLPMQKVFTLRNYQSSQSREEINLVLLLPRPGYPYVVGILLDVLCGFLLLPLITLERPKLIYVRSATLGLPIVFFKRLHKAKVIVKIAGILEDDLKGVVSPRTHPLDFILSTKLLSVIERYVLHNADRIAVHSPLFYIELCKLRREKNPMPPLIIPPGIDLNNIYEVMKVSNTNRQKNVVTIGFVGSLSWWQGIDILVKAVQIIQKEINKEIMLLIIGDGPLRKSIESLCDKLKIRCKITGFVQHINALKLMKNLNVLVVPRLRISATETTIPLKVIEAWALGVPVVITKHKIFEHLERSGKKLAILCEPIPESVAQAIKIVMHDHQLVNQLRANCLLFAKQFSYDVLAERILKVAHEGCDL